jgi:hypothetical protein
MRIRNKALLATGAALALSVSMLAATLGAASAATLPPPDPARNCSFTALTTFASPGISKNGSTSTSKVSTTTSTGSTYNCGSAGSATTPDLNIVSKATSKCDKKVVGQQDNKGAAPSSNPNCDAAHAGQKVYDTASGFATGGTGTLQKAVKKTTIIIAGVTYMLKTTAVAAIAPGGSCGGEVGFLISGQVKKPKQDKAQTSSLRACLGHDTGPGTTGSFAADLISELGGNTGITIATATIDPATSVLHIG